ncbi:MAG: hypothetical protein ACLSVD_09740 [Eggerthellaceae bacterium]
MRDGAGDEPAPRARAGRVLPPRNREHGRHRRDCGITDDEAYEALDELVEWGSIAGPTKQDKYNTYRAPWSSRARSR